MAPAATRHTSSSATPCGAAPSLSSCMCHLAFNEMHIYNDVCCSWSINREELDTRGNIFTIRDGKGVGVKWQYIVFLYYVTRCRPRTTAWAWSTTGCPSSSSPWTRTCWTTSATPTTLTSTRRTGSSPSTWSATPSRSSPNLVYIDYRCTSMCDVTLGEL